MWCVHRTTRSGSTPPAKKSGRGAYVCAKEEYVDLAKKKKALDRALKTKVGEEVYERLREYIVTGKLHE